MIVELLRRPKNEALAYLEGARNAYAACASFTEMPRALRVQLEALAVITEAQRVELEKAP